MDPKSYRINVWKDTYSKQKNYPFHNSTKFNFDELAIESDVNYETKIIIENIDTIDGALKLLQSGLNPLVLNMASITNPGGGVRNGASAQEEVLFRRSNYDLTLNKSFYPLKYNEVVYSPKVVIFKDSQYKMIEPFTLDFIACAALKNPPTFNGKYNVNDYNIMKNKIKMIFNLALKTNHDSVVVGALGCGAYHNPPEEVIKIYNEIIEENRGKFKVIYFAILSHKDNNFELFRKGIKL